MTTFGTYAKNLRTLIAVLVAAAPALGAGFQFPSAGSSKSPDGKWTLDYKSPSDGDSDSRHLILLKRTNGRSIELRRFDRSCDALWSPDSSRIAVTDRWASDTSDVLIYSVRGRKLSRSLRNLFPTNAIAEAELSGHCYFEAREWLSPRRLLIKISGHTDEAPAYPFERQYIFDLKPGKFQKISEKKPGRSVRRTGVSRFARSKYERDRRLVPVADPVRWNASSP